MNFDAGDRARLKLIERQLLRDDPRLADAFEQWAEPAADGRDGMTVVPAWALAVFLVGFATWVVGPLPGLIAAVVGTSWARWARRPPRDLVRRATASSPGQHRRPPGPPIWPGAWGPM